MRKIVGITCSVSGTREKLLKWSVHQKVKIKKHCFGPRTGINKGKKQGQGQSGPGGGAVPQPPRERPKDDLLGHPTLIPSVPGSHRMGGISRYRHCTFFESPLPEGSGRWPRSASLQALESSPCSPAFGFIVRCRQSLLRWWRLSEELRDKDIKRTLSSSLAQANLSHSR